jgi:acetolactate synthase-1/2/3 large subunit
LRKYSDALADLLLEAGYTTCFSLGGGNIMHLVESFSRKFEIVPVVHEVSACIAAEYFNELEVDRKAFALVTTGPGLTNSVTAIASAFLESRELLVIGGQVKTDDLGLGALRQRGIQELDGVSVVSSITKAAARLDETLDMNQVMRLVELSWSGRKGPVFLEVPLDTQARKIPLEESTRESPLSDSPVISSGSVSLVKDLLCKASRPIILLGGGLDFRISRELHAMLEGLGVPVMTTWNGADRFDNESNLYFGRPNTWGQRYSNILIQQSDLIIAIGARLGLQQTGFNWREFAAGAKIVQVDLDIAELKKAKPEIDHPIQGDAGNFLQMLLTRFDDGHPLPLESWLQFCRRVKSLLPLAEKSNYAHPGYWDPYVFYRELGDALSETDVLLPSSSGSSFTCAYQAVTLPFGSRMLSSKSLASMGYGLGAALGIAKVPGKRPVLVEGDGGFAQNMQDVGTLFRANPKSKVFIWDNDGYASIRKTQMSYFDGNYVGCDLSTGLVLPDWEKLFHAFGIKAETLNPGSSIEEALASDVSCFIVPIHPEQSFFPKLSSRVKADGGMESAPLHVMTPELDIALAREVFVFNNSFESADTRS